MAVPLGAWTSTFGISIRDRWERARSQALDIATPQVLAQTRNVFGQEPPQIRPTAGGLDARAQALRGIDMAGRTPRAISPAMGAQQAAFAGMRPGAVPTPTRPGPLMMQRPGPIRDMAQIAPSGAQGPFPFQGGRNPLELLAAAGTAIGNLPVPGGPITVAPGFRGRRPSATISVPRQQTIADVNRFESMIAERTTEPVGRFVGENLVKGVLPPGVPGRERAADIGGEVGATVFGEGIRASNLIPIPVIDPLAARAVASAARLAKVTLGPAARVTREQGRKLVEALGRAVAGEPDEAVRGALAQFRGDLAKTLQSERGAVPLGPGGGKPVPDNLRVSASDQGVTDVPLNQIDVRAELFQARDVSVAGEGVGEKRVRELIENFDPARLDPIHVVRDPENPGRFIVRDGHHRAAAVRGKFGADASIPAIIVEGDIRDATFLSKMRLEAVASNFSVAEMNVREQVRSVRALTESGLDLDRAATQLRMKPSEARDLADIDLLGAQVLDRIVAEPAVIPIAAEVGRAMRLFNVDAEQAGALFARFSQVDDKGRVVTRSSLRSTLAKFAPKLEGVALPGFDSALGGADTRSGILELIADVGRTRAQLESERGALRAAIKATARLGESSGLKSEASALVRFGEKAVQQVEVRIKTLEKDLSQQLRREAVTPSGITTERAVSETPLLGAETPPTERPTGAVTFGEERIAPQFGSQQPEFRGEQSGIAPRMFDDAETGFRGQGSLEDVARPAAEQPPAEPPRRPPTGGPPPPPEPLGQPPRGAFERGQRPRVEGQPTLPGELAPEGVSGEPAAGSVESIQADLDPLAAMRRDLEATYFSDPELGDAPTVFHRDAIGEQQFRDSLPTSADVRSWSASTPPELRAARAEEMRDVKAGMQDFDAVVNREIGFYSDNVFTKLDDIIQPLLGRDRAKQTAVRILFAKKDIYERRMTDRMRLAVQFWIAEHKGALGLTTTNLDPITRKVLGQNQRGLALKVQPRPDADIPARALQRVDHIVEHPEKYMPLTPEQRAALDDYTAILEDNRQALLRAGGDVGFIEEYAPHVITSTPRGVRREVAAANLATRFPVTHPWFTKARAVPDIEELLKLGYGIADPLAALEIRLVAGTRTIANVETVKAARKLGVTSAEQIPDALRVQLKEATVAQIAARNAALKSGSTADAAAVQKASVVLDRAQHTMRLAARKIAERRPKVFGRDVSPDVAEEMKLFIGANDENFVDDMLRVMRTTLVGADLGSLYLQNATTFWRNPAAWGQGAALGLRSIARTPHDFILRNADDFLLMAEYGFIGVPDEFILARGGRFPQLLGEAPIIKESQTFLENNVMFSQFGVAKGVMRFAKTDKEFFELATVLRNRSGMSFTPGLTARQASWMRKLLFAKNFTVAITSSVLDPVIRTGVARREAMKGMGAIFGGAASLVVAGNMVESGTPGNFTDPDKPGFWGVPVPGGYVFPLGPFQPLVVATTRTARVATDIARGRKPSDRDVKAWPRFITNKASIGVRWATRAAEALGLPLENLVGPSFGRPEIIREGESSLSALRREVANILPIGPRQAVEGLRGGNFPTGALEIAGVRTTPSSTFAKFREAFREEFGRDYNGAEGDRTIAMQKPRLRELLEKSQRESLRRGQPFAIEREEREEAIAGLAQDLTPFAEGVRVGNPDAGAQFLRAYSSFKTQRSGVFQRDFFGEEFPERETEVGKALDGLGEMDPNAPPYLDSDLETGTFQTDWDLWDADQERLFAIIEREHPGFTADYKTRSFLPEEFADVERQAIGARGLRDELGEISPIRGISIETWGLLQDFWRDVNDLRSQARDQGNTVGVEDAIRRLAAHRDLSAAFTEGAIMFRSGAKARETMRNPVYVMFLVNNYDELFPFYRDNLYGSNWIQDIIFQAKQAGRIGETAPASELQPVAP